MLYVGDFLVVGENYGKIKVMIDSNGGCIKEVGFSILVQILGFLEVLSSGEMVVSVKNEYVVCEIVVQCVLDCCDEEDVCECCKVQCSFVDLFGLFGEVYIVNLILCVDIQGSLEVIQGILVCKEIEDVKFNVMFVGIGVLIEGDVLFVSIVEV